MIAFVAVLALALACGAWVVAVVSADGRGHRPAPRSHRHEVVLDQHARLLELNR